MTASVRTAIDIIDVMSKHLSEDQINLLLDDLVKVKGNRSFTDTIKLIRNEWRRK